MWRAAWKVARATCEPRASGCRPLLYIIHTIHLTVCYDTYLRGHTKKMQVYFTSEYTRFPNAFFATYIYMHKNHHWDTNLWLTKLIIFLEFRQLLQTQVSTITFSLDIDAIATYRWHKYVKTDYTWFLISHFLRAIGHCFPFEPVWTTCLGLMWPSSGSLMYTKSLQCSGYTNISQNPNVLCCNIF
jgi:hypothetical protein